MTIEPPHPPTAPAPGIRPTPPTPPKIDMAPFHKEDGTTHKTSDDVYEDMARDAVANGSGALTKRTIDRGDNRTPRQNSSTPAQVADTQSNYDRGQDVLREFQEMDARPAQRTETFSAQTEQPRAVKINHDEGNGAVFWIFTIIFVAVATFFIVKKFLFTDKPQLFADKKTTTIKPPPPAPKPPPKKEDKGKRFEVRI